jgi:hypothetical protein
MSGLVWGPTDVEGGRPGALGSMHLTQRFKQRLIRPADLVEPVADPDSRLPTPHQALCRH